jgi:hypothetical protein
VPIHCRVVKDLNDFDGSWTVRTQSLAHLNLILIFLAQMWESATWLFLNLIVITDNHVTAGMMDEVSLKVCNCMRFAIFSG